MKKKRLRKRQLLEKQKLDEKKFNRSIRIVFGILFLSLISILIFYTYWCDTKYAWRKIAWYGNEVPGNQCCMNEDKLQFHESAEIVFDDKTYYFCSKECFNHLVKHYKEVAIVSDAFTGDLINKADAIIGLKEKNKPEIVYFKNIENFNQFYEKVNE